MLHFAGERLGYGETSVLHDLSFSLAPGERVVLLGRSGAGKSTLLAESYRRLAGSTETVALVPQENGLVPQLSVFHNVFMGRLDRAHALYNLANLVRPFAAERARVGPVLEAVGLRDFARTPVERLSGGQKQRTALARALYRGGPVLLADEPVSAVDERQAAALLETLKGQFETMLIALHDVALARRVASRLVGLKAGRIAFDRPAAAVTDAELDDLYRA